MRQIVCQACGKSASMNDAAQVRDRTLCIPCADKQLKAEPTPKEQVRRLSDPTVCGNCAKDNGNMDLGTISGIPVCQACEDFLRKRPLPVWVKMFFLAIVVVVVGAFVYNVRFVRAYLDMRAGHRAMAAGEVAQAIVCYRSAAQHVPENTDLSVLGMLVEGISLLQQDKCAEALSIFRRCKAATGNDSIANALILQAEAGVAFNARDYDKFLAISQQQMNASPTKPGAVAAVASALACKYVVSSNETYRHQSVDMLEKAKKLAQPGDEFGEYEQRILYRLHAREIITTAEFKKRFPNGWSPERKEQP